ncbi:ParM/StbA family protein [Nostoc sp. FACHB-190]|uniref:ParM/StbA family protein n=1 Tax=Nostoc sp. FACHB-190 TaxID=2692838 RepID=UPI0016866EEF|nr:ParM/StbA family protein [Nostoc sp. FACHB-190]MBD2302246.1 ParM/StbA family protein [Nostoc sp. FACHB-190]
MADLTIAFDPGSSLSKIFYTLKSFQPELLLMEPEVAQVPVASLVAYESSCVGSPAPENSAWVEYKGQYRAVGFLAQDRFYADLKLSEPKFELALYKTLALVGALVQKKSLPNGATINLGVLLPYGEYEDRKLFEQLVTEALAGFRFRGVEHSFELKSFLCRPEGFGLISRGRAPGSSLKECKIAVIMIGYRNISVLIMDRGMISQGITEDLGFNKLVGCVQRLVSGQKPLKLAAAISKAGSKISTKALTHLVRVQDPGLRDTELSQIRSAVTTAREEYWISLTSWLRSRIPSDVDEIIFAGGTAHYLSRELNNLFPYVQKVWCNELEAQINRNFLADVSRNGLEFRLTDNYGLFYYLCGSAERMTTHA